MSKRIVGAIMVICATLGLPAAAGALPTWLAASPLSQSAAESAATAMGSDGSAAVAWLGAGAGGIVQVATRPPLGSFAPALDVSPAGENRAPQVAEDAAGDATVVWWRLGSSIPVEAATVTDGMPSAPLTLSPAGKEAFFPAVAMNDRGDTIVAWASREGSTVIVQAAFRPAGGSFGAAVNVSASGVSVESPRVAIDAAGDATVVWERSTGGHEVVEEATRSAATGTFSPKPVVLSNEAEPAIHPFAAMNAEGDTAVTWTASNGTVELAQVAVRPAGGTFDKAVSVSAEVADAAFPQVALDGRGDPSVVWTLEFGGSLIVQYAAGTSSGTFPTVQDLAFESWAPSIAEDPAGDTLVSYADALSNSAFALLRPAEGRFGEPQEVSPVGQVVSANGVSDEQGLNAAMDSAGDGVVGFTIEGSEGLAEASLLDAGGPVLQSVSIPATATAGVPVSFSVAPVDQVDSTPGVAWAFGDASTASGDSVTHTFAAPGTYSVSVTATVAPGDSATRTATITILPPSAPPLSVPAFKAATLGSATVTADRHGRVQLQVSCPAGGAACAGTVALTLPATATGLAVAARAQGTPVTVSAGHASFSVAAGASTAVSVGLPTVVLQLLGRHHRLTLAVVLETHGASGQSATTSGKVLVRAYAKPKKSKRKKR